MSETHDFNPAIGVQRAMSKPQSTPPGFKELEFRKEGNTWVADGPFGVPYIIGPDWLNSRWFEVYISGVRLASNKETYEAAVQAANEHCHKELGRWVR